MSIALPCPYCSCSDVDSIHTEQGFMWTCRKCHASGPVSESKSDARLAWNSIPRIVRTAPRIQPNTEPQSWWKRTPAFHRPKTEEKMTDFICEICGKPAKYFGWAEIKCPPVKEGDKEVSYCFDPVRSACSKEHLAILAPAVIYTHVPPPLLARIIDDVQILDLGFSESRIKYLVSAMHSCAEGLEKGLEHLKQVNAENARYGDISQTLLNSW